MTKQIVLPSDQVTDLEAVEMIAEGVGRLHKADVTVVHQVVISTENIPAFFALQDLLGAKPGPEEREKSKKSGGRPKAWTRQRHFDGGSEQLRAVDVYRGLNDHTFLAGDRFHHPKSGWQVLVVDEGGGPDRLVPAKGEGEGEQA